MPKEWDEAKIRAGIKSVMQHIINIFNTVDPNYDGAYYAYHILGPDILFDNEFNPWLLEVNICPSNNPVYNTKTPGWVEFHKEFLHREFEHGVSPYIPGNNTEHQEDINA